MNPTDAEIAGKLTGTKRGDYAIHQTAGCLYLDTLHGDHLGCEVTTQYIAHPDEFLAFCRAVVEQVDGENTIISDSPCASIAKEYQEQFTVEEYQHWLGLREYRNENDMADVCNLIQDIGNPNYGIAATTARHRKEQG